VYLQNGILIRRVHAHECDRRRSLHAARRNV